MSFPKGNKLGGRPKGSKNVATLLKEERRAIFEQRASEMWEEVITKLPPTYIADQFMGKAPDSLDITTKGESLNEASEAAILAAEHAYLQTLDGTDRPTEST